MDELNFFLVYCTDQRSGSIQLPAEDVKQILPCITNPIRAIAAAEKMWDEKIAPQRHMGKSGKVYPHSPRIIYEVPFYHACLHQRWQKLITAMLEDRFLKRDTIQDFDSAATFEMLMDYYNQPWRAFHTLERVYAMLHEFDDVKEQANNSHFVEFAIFFADCVFFPEKDDNKAQSAGIAKTVYQRMFGIADLRTGQYDTVEQLILAAEHKHPMQSHDQRLFCDIDLAYLGASMEIFEHSMGLLRKEYARLDDKEFVDYWCEFFTRLRARETIYQTEHFRVRYEQQAQTNLRRFLAENSK